MHLPSLKGLRWNLAAWGLKKAGGEALTIPSHETKQSCASITLAILIHRVHEQIFDNIILL